MAEELPTTYYVWRRNDETPGISVYDPNYAPGKAKGQSFTILEITEDWDEADKVLKRCQRLDEFLAELDNGAGGSVPAGN